MKAQNTKAINPYKVKNMEQLINFYYRLLERYSEFTQMRYLYDEINWKKGLSVELRNSDAIVVASNTFSFVESGEGVVMAYKNATSRPSEPTVEDLSQLSDGWSRTPQKGGSHEKVSNISYGNYSAGNTDSGYSTSEWSEVSDSRETWRKSPAGLGNSGWALMKVLFTTNVDNSDVKFIIKAYSEYNCDFIQVHALDTEITGSPALRLNGVFNESGNGVESTHSFTSVKAGQHFFYVSYCKDVSINSNGDYGLFRFDLSDNLASMPSTVWMSQAVLKEGKAVLPWSTPVQITGDDAYRVEVSPATLVFDTNENGLVDTLSGKYATVTVYKGNQKISTDNLSLPSNYATPSYTNVHGEISNVNGEARITIDSIRQETISGDVTVSKSSGQISFPIDVLGERSTLMWVTVNVQVNVSKFTGSVAFDNKGYKAQFDELSKNAATKNELKDVTSTFEQTAREISLSVSEKSVGRRNLLVGSAFQRDDNNVEISDGARIEMNSGYQGTNCIHIIDDTDGTPHYPGAFWDGSQGGKSIEITKGKKYIISCWYMTNDANGHLYLEALYTDKQTNAKRKGGPNYLSPSAFTVKKVNEWELFTAVIDTTDAQYNYLAFNFFESCNGNFGRINAWICRPMVEEGDTYNGWTLSQDDYDIIGANLIDNSRTFDVGGNTLEAIGTKTLKGDVYELTYRGSAQYNTFYRIDTSNFKLDTDYTLSFDVKGDAKYMGVYAYYPITNTKFTFYAEPQNGVMTEVTDGGKVDNYVALIQVKELSKQQRVWSHFRFKDRLPEQIYFQFPKNSEQTGVTSWSVTITRPKIEVGAVVTEYTERKSDLVDKASLKKAGIEITSDMVELYGNQVKVSGAKGGTPVAMFENGMLNSHLINADKIMARQLDTTGSNGQRVSIEDGLMQIFGKNGVCNIKFGVNDNGEAILSYYDMNGKWLYDLGPNKLDGSQITSSTVTINEYVKATTKPGTNDFYNNVMYLGKEVKQVKFQYSQLLFGNNIFMNEDDEIQKNGSAHIGYQPFANVSNVTKLYRYSAPRMGNAIVKDDKYGLTTADLAKRADGKYFTSMTMASGGSLVNLAPVGVYFVKNEAVKYAPYPIASVGSTNDRFPAFTIGGLEISKAGVGSSMTAFNGFFSYLTRKVI